MYYVKEIVLTCFKISGIEIASAPVYFHFLLGRYIYRIVSFTSEYVIPFPFIRHSTFMTTLTPYHAVGDVLI